MTSQPPLGRANNKMQFVKISVVFVAFLNAIYAQLFIPPCSNYISTQYSTCQDIFLQLQKQIVDSDANLYSLRKVFYPTAETEPSLVNVSYLLTVTSTRNVSCPGDVEVPLANPRYDRIPNDAHRFLEVHAWSSKIFYTIFHPGTINRLQPQFLQELLSTMESIYATGLQTPRALTWSTVGPILTVQLTIDVELSCWPTFDALVYGLRDLTSALKIYADSGENVSSWGADEKGYALLGNVFINQWWIYNHDFYPSSNSLPLVNGILSIIVTLMICFGVYYALSTVAPVHSKQKNFLFSHSVVWTGVALLLIANFILLLYELIGIDLWCQVNSCSESAAASKVVWFIWMAVFMIVAFVVLLVRFLQGKMKHQDLFVPEWRAFVIGIPLLSTLVLVLAVCYKLLIRPLLKIRQICNLWIYLMETLRYILHIPRPFKTALWKIVHFSAIYILYMTVFVSASILTFSVVPILLQTFLFPFRIIAAYSYFCIAFFLYALATFVAVFMWKEKTPTTGRLILYLSSTTVTLTFIFVISVPFVSLYRLLVSGSFSDNPIVLFGVSVLPSLLLSSPLVYIFKSKLLPRFLEVDEEEESEDEDKVKKKKDRKTEESDASEDVKVELASL